MTTILNVVLDEVFRYWESFVAEIAGGDRRDDDAVQLAGRTILQATRDNSRMRRDIRS